MGETATTWRCSPTRFMFSTTTTLLSQRAEHSPLWLETFTKRRMGRGITGISRVLSETAKRGGASRLPPLARRDGAPHERGAGGGTVGRDRIATTPQIPAVERFTVGADHSGFPTGGGTGGP